MKNNYSKQRDLQPYRERLNKLKALKRPLNADEIVELRQLMKNLNIERLTD